MRLDGVCRGSIIFHEGRKFVVTGEGRDKRSRSLVYWVTAELLGEGTVRLGGDQLFFPDNEVDLCFPGDVYALPDHIR